MRIEREELLKKLESVLPGLALKPVIEQSQCFVFTEKNLVTFNDEVACSVENPFKFEGAIPAKPLIQLLHKLTEKEIEIRFVEGEMLIRAGKKKSGISMEHEVTLPIEELDETGDWSKLPENFSKAVKIVATCSGKDESQFVLTCLHIHPKYVEACDDFQAIRYPLKIKLDESVLIKQNSIKTIIGLDMTEWSHTDNWTHFRNPSGLVLSCRKYLEKYPDLSKILAIKGKDFKLPSNIEKIVSNAEIFLSDNIANDSIMVRMKSGKMELKGEGPSGWYKETQIIEYDGDPISFAIPPKLLVEISKKSNSCQLGESGLRVDGDGFAYVTCIEKVE